MTFVGLSPSTAWAAGTPAVICHDAGAAAHAIAWLVDEPSGPRDAVIYAEGPARLMVMSRGLRIADRLEEALAGAPWALVGTGWQSNLEQQVMKQCAQVGKPCVAIVDHWVNYPNRFNGLTESERPEVVVVTDSIAEQIACRLLPWAAVALWPNSQRDAFVLNVREHRANRMQATPYLLWIHEPIRDADGTFTDPLADPRYAPVLWDEIEFAARTYSLSHVVVRHHPSSQGRADYGARRIPIQVREGGSTPLADDVAGAGLCMGINSYALYLCAEAGIKTVSLASTVGMPRSAVLPNT